MATSMVFRCTAQAWHVSLVLAVCAFCAQTAQAEPEGRWSLTPSFNDFGGTGLIQMPTARMAPDGELAFGASYASPYTRYFATAQILPWMQATFRYTDIGYEEYDISDGQSYKDKSVDVKLRLIKESADWPEVSLGFRDLGGTGIFSSEYVALSRRYYDWDFTVGGAWGNMASGGFLPNPFGFVSDRMKQRSGGSDQTGALQADLFRGEHLGLFAGAQWDTPLDGVRLKLEYDSNDYQSEFRGEKLDVLSPINGAIEYSPVPWFDMALGYERGNTVMFRGVLSSNMNTSKGLPNLDERPPPPAETAQRIREPGATPSAFAPGALDAALIRASVDQAYSTFEQNGLKVTAFDLVAPTITISLAPDSNQAPDALARSGLAVAHMLPINGAEHIVFRNANGQALASFEPSRLIQRSVLQGPELTAEAPLSDAPEEITKRLTQILEGQGFQTERVGLAGHKLVVVFSQKAYLNSAKAFGRVARAAALATSPSILEFDLIETSLGLPIARVTMPRDQIIAAARQDISIDELWMAVEALPPEIPDDIAWGALQESYPVYSWTMQPRLRQTIGGPDNFYLFQFYGELGAAIRPAPGWNISGNVGVNLYNNFDGFRYTPPSNLPRVRTDIRKYLVETDAWLDNLHVDYLAQPAPDVYTRLSAGIFELMYGGVGGEILYHPINKTWAVGLDINHVWQRDFSGGVGFKDYNITTGHLTWYQDLPFYDMQTSLSLGRYLAGDIGGTLTLSRKFENGVKVGAWATKTNISAETFGEGSFDKGFILSIPFDLFSTSPTKSVSHVAYRPVFSDGGQKVGTPMPLYDLTGARRSVAQGWRDGMN